MLAGCSSSLLSSPRHRLRSEASSTQFQACHFPSMSTQRLDLPCNFPRKESSRSQSIRPAGISVESQSRPSSNCSLRQNVNVRPPTTAQTGLKKRYAETGLFDEESGINRSKRIKSNEEDEDLKLASFGSSNFWLSSGFDLPCSIPRLTCSGEEERERERERERTQTQGLVIREARSSGSGSSESHGLIQRLDENVSEIGIVNGSSLVNRAEDSSQTHDGLELVSLLVSCVDAIGLKNIPGITHYLARLGELASPRVGSTIHRLTSYFTEALALRVAHLWPNIFHIAPPREIEDNGTALRLYNEVTPVPKFIHFTANEIILRAFEGKDRVHIIDFDIKQGLQWPGLFQSLANRKPNPPSFIRVTGIGESKQDLLETGARLAGFAESMNLPFEFHPVVDRLEDVRLWMLHVKDKECVAVNCVFQLHKLLYDGTGNVLNDFLGLIRSINPDIMIVTEQEVSDNSSIFDTRFSEALKYYSAIFDSLDSNYNSRDENSLVRFKIEEMFGKEIRNVIACEGRVRSERHESFGKWREMMERGSFRCIGVTEREFLQSCMLLRIYSGESYQVEVQGRYGGGGAALTLSWEEQPLFTVSAWAPSDIAGSSGAI